MESVVEHQLISIKEEQNKTKQKTIFSDFHLVITVQRTININFQHFSVPVDEFHDENENLHKESQTFHIKRALNTLIQMIFQIED